MVEKISTFLVVDPLGWSCEMCPGTSWLYALLWAAHWDNQQVIVLKLHYREQINQSSVQVHHVRKEEYGEPKAKKSDGIRVPNQSSEANGKPVKCGSKKRGWEKLWRQLIISKEKTSCSRSFTVCTMMTYIMSIMSYCVLLAVPPPYLYSLPKGKILNLYTSFKFPKHNGNLKIPHIPIALENTDIQTYMHTTFIWHNKTFSGYFLTTFEVLWIFWASAIVIVCKHTKYLPWQIWRIWRFGTSQHLNSTKQWIEIWASSVEI